MASNNEIILYHYSFSPYARRIAWYLALRGIPYSQCLQPAMMPRPDVARLGVAYRRIPILTIGRDVYLDSRLQLAKLESLFPELPTLGASTHEKKALQHLLSTFIIDGGIFSHAANLLPTSLPVFKDPKFYKDRADLMGRALTAERMDKARPQALGAFARAFAFLETTLLADGRDWILNTKEPSLGDIEAIWPFHWLSGLPGALPEEQFSPKTYPKVYAWIQRFQDAVLAAKKKVAKPITVSGDDAAKIVLGAAFCEPEKQVDEKDATVVALGLKRGDVVKVWPTDTGSSCRDVGKLVGLDIDEVVIETVAEGGSSVRVHAPRNGFAVTRAEKEASKL